MIWDSRLNLFFFFGSWAIGPTDNGVHTRDGGMDRIPKGTGRKLAFYE
jgi:hypothetical protein